MKEKNPQYEINTRKNMRIATHCRVCGGQLLTAEEIKNEIHDRCNVDNTNMYMM